MKGKELNERNKKEIDCMKEGERIKRKKQKRNKQTKEKQRG